MEADMNWKTWKIQLVAAALSLGFAVTTIPVAFAASDVPNTGPLDAAVSSILDAQRDSDPLAASFARLMATRPAITGEPTIRTPDVDPLRSTMVMLLADAEPWYHVPATALPLDEAQPPGR
jgi:hypothetical protein